MQILCYTLQPLSAFGTPLAGDTLFGQLCWTLRHQLGNDRLTALLNGYTSGQPFMVVSDALPTGHVPLPHVPTAWWDKSGGVDRKALKKKRWLPVAALSKPFVQWQGLATDDAQVAAQTQRAQPHNTINRQTGTTGDGEFAPYAMPQIWFAKTVRFDVHIVLDESRLSANELIGAMDAIGTTGFGRDASVGLGKFKRVGDIANSSLPVASQASSYLTLGPCAPQGLGFCPVRSTYQVVTRFGRHGDAAVQLGQAFKRPVLLAKAGGVFWPEVPSTPCQFIGQGLGGAERPVSRVMLETVQQGYAPVIAIASSAEVCI